MVSPQCRDEKNLLDIESYAYVGKIRSVSTYKCGKKRKYIAVETIDGQKICSPCLEEDIIDISSRMLELYLKNVKLVTSS